MVSRREVIAGSAAGAVGTAATFFPGGAAQAEPVVVDVPVVGKLRPTDAVGAALAFLHGVVADDSVEIEVRISAAATLASVGMQAGQDIMLHHRISYDLELF